MEIKSIKKDELLAIALYCVSDKKSKFVYNNINIKEIGIKLLNELEREQAKPQLTAEQLQQADVISPVCSICGGKGSYSYGGSFGGAVSTVRCNCGANYL